MTRTGDVFEFEGFRLDLRRMGLWNDQGPVPIEPKALDVLCHLVLHRDRLVTKDELLDHVWTDTFVTPNALTRAVAQLRKVLGDEAERPRAIETVAKRGYRFIATVTVVPTVDATADVAPPRIGPRGRRTRAAVLTVAALVVALVIGWRVAASRSDHRAAGTLDIAPLTSLGDVIDAIVSADGKYLAFVRSSQGQQSLWIRQLHGTNPVQLVAPQAVSYYGMSFAPDSASIYYVVRGPEPLAYPTGMLFQIPTLGGAPRRLGIPFDHYPVVSPDGSQLASLRADYPAPGQSALLVANADGSKVHPLVAVREPEILAPGFFIAPGWSPAGDRIAAGLRDGSRDRAQLFTVDVSTGSMRRFATTFASASFASWMPDGSGIVFTAAAQRTPASEFGSDLWFQPLPDGRPRQITTGLVQYRNVTITTDGSSLVSVGNLQNAGLWRLPLDGGRLEHIPSQREDGLVGLGWLDANTIAFTSFDGGTSQIWTMDLEGANRRQITTDGWNYLPRASRNGQTIFFAATRDGRPGLWRMDRTGAAQRRIVETHGATDLSLTADERSVLFTAPGGDRLDSTWTVSVDGGRPTLLVKGLSRAAASPDGASLAGFWQQGPNARIMLAVFPAGGGEPSAVFDVGAPAANGGVWWSRDGRVLYYTGSDRVNVWRQPLAGGAPAVVTDLADSMISRGDLSPDGRTLLAVRANPRRDAFLIRGFR